MQTKQTGGQTAHLQVNYKFFMTQHNGLSLIPFR